MQLTANLTVLILTLLPGSDDRPQTIAAGAQEHNTDQAIAAKTQLARSRSVECRLDDFELDELDDPIQSYRPSNSHSQLNPPLVLELGTPFVGTGSAHVSPGFFIFNDRYLATGTLTWHSGQLNIETTERNTKERTKPSTTPVMMAGAGNCHGHEPAGPSWDVEISELQMIEINRALRTGGVVSLPESGEVICIDFLSGGMEAVEALTLPVGPQREEIVAMGQGFGLQLTPEAKSWLMNFRPETSLKLRAGQVIQKVDRIEMMNMVELNDERRLSHLGYPLTLTAMGMCIFSIGTLLVTRPQNIVSTTKMNTSIASETNTPITAKHRTSITRFLWLIAALATIDLVWELLEHRASQASGVTRMTNLITNTIVSPSNQSMLAGPEALFILKGLATITVLAILYWTRHTLLARKACWWICLTLTLMIGRWIATVGVSI